MSGSPYYDAWVADGKPWRLATPIKECADKIKTARAGINPALLIGTIGDPAHLLAIPPEDHTPYSQTGWPAKHPYPVVNALDIMHRPDLGVDCNAVFPHWLAAAKAGQLPWLKYLVWQAKRYDVRNGWAPVASSGHYDHMHASGRTDTISTSIGGFHPLPGYGDDMDSYERALLEDTAYRVDADWVGSETVRGGTWKGQPCQPVIQRNRIEAKVDALAAKVGAPASVDPAELRAAVKVALLDPEVLAGIAKAVADEDHRRSAE